MRHIKKASGSVDFSVGIGAKIVLTIERKVFSRIRALICGDGHLRCLREGWESSLLSWGSELPVRLRPRRRWIGHRVPRV